MKQALQLKLGQQLTLTPQLQQAIKLLQLSTLDLKQTISETLASNPLLDEEEQHPEPVDDGVAERVDFSESVSETMPDAELQVDTAWEDVMPSSAPASTSVSGASGDDLLFADRDSLPETLQSHLLWQLNLTRFSETEHSIRKLARACTTSCAWTARNGSRKECDARIGNTSCWAPGPGGQLGESSRLVKTLFGIFFGLFWFFQSFSSPKFARIFAPA